MDIIKLPVKLGQMPQAYAEEIMQFVRRSFLLTYKCIKIIGINVNRVGDKTGNIDQFFTPEASTDLILDFKIALAKAVYSPADSVKELMMQPIPPADIISGNSSMRVYNKGDTRIGALTIIKKFDETNALTYRDLSSFFNFVIEDLDAPLIKVFNKSIELEITLFIQEVTGVNDEITSSVNCKYVFGDDTVTVFLATDALVGLSLYMESTREGISLVLEGSKDDVRLQSIQKHLNKKVEKATALFLEPQPI